jgi:hypothetical protein
VISKVHPTEFLLVLGWVFGQFLSIFKGLGQFRGFLAPHFLIFDTFQSPRHGILAPRTRG